MIAYIDADLEKFTSIQNGLAVQLSRCLEKASIPE